MLSLVLHKIVHRRGSGSHVKQFGKPLRRGRCGRMTRPIIIGAGMAGIACARGLKDAGRNPLILDKGRGIGGRLATRRTEEGWHFDHGAQYIRAKSERFVAAIDAAVSPWKIDDGPAPLVGTPGMSGLAKSLAAGLDIRSSTEVTSIKGKGAYWIVSTAQQSFETDTLILTAPAPQTAALIGSGHPHYAEVQSAEMLPNLTLMVGFGDARPASGVVARRDSHDPIAWIAHNSTKPGRPKMDAWIAQASLAYSQKHLEEDKESIANDMLPLLCDRLGVDQSHVRYASAHRWRYATVGSPVGQPYLNHNALYLGGDWCIGSKVEDAWTSGTAIAQAILERS